MKTENWHGISSLYRTCVCVCVRDRERERERQTDIERKIDCARVGVYVCGRVLRRGTNQILIKCYSLESHRFSTDTNWNRYDRSCLQQTAQTSVIVHYSTGSVY